MAYLLSDDELRQKLKLLGEDVGPVTPSTRRALQKRLDSILKGKNRTLNTLSSDDSELEQQGSSGKNQNKKKRYNHRSSHVPPIAHQLSNLILNERKDVFKKPLPTPPKHLSRLSSEGSPLIKKNPSNIAVTRKSTSSRKNCSSYEKELSDSDMDTETLLSPMRTLKLRNKTNHVLSDNSDGYSSIFKRTERSFLASTPNGDEYAVKCRNVDQKKDWQVNVPRNNFRLSRSNDNKYSRDFNANGYLSSDPLNGVFGSESKNPGKTVNYWLYVSWMLVLVTAAFFVFLGVFYISAIQKTQLAASISHLESFKCQNNENESACIPPEYFTSVLSISHELHNLLSAVAGEFECQIGRESRNLTFSATKKFLEASFSKVDSTLSFDNVFEYAILLSLRNPDWGISVFSENGELLENTQLAYRKLHSVSALESKHASKSFWCRLHHSVQWTISRLLLILLATSFVFSSFIGLKYWKKQKDLEEKEFYELVEKILDALQIPDEGSSASSSLPLPCKAVVHLRDKLLPLKERRLKQHLWDRAVAFIEENESRVQVDHECIGGENFKVWRWLPSPTSETEEGKKGKVWQGQAFGSLTKGKNLSFSPTPCLKIRNMFDYEVEYGNDWQTCVTDAILEKCEENNGIVHIAVDTTSKEGCVYVLCDSTASAGKAHNALHGWWFDGKLLTVKYLRLERYLERFPEAEYCEEPLKPSNNKRLSLSAPFFSSALERS